MITGLLGLLLALPLACDPGPPAPTKATPPTGASLPRPDIVLVTIETVRADFLGSNGGRDTMPHLDAFAKNALVYGQATSPSSWTLPAVASILTGEAPSVHGLTRTDRRLPDDALTAQKTLQSAGYQTAFFGVNAVFLADRGLNAGFDTWNAWEGRSGGQLVNDVLQWADTRTDAPTFLHVHLFDPHCPYRPPDNHAAAFPPQAPPKPLAQDAWRQMAGCYRMGSDDAPVLDTQAYRAAYEAELAFADAQVSRLLRGLGQRGMGDAMVILTADHGETFWEHGDYGHARQLYEESVRVPLMVRPAGPSRPGSRDDRPMSTTRVYADILRAAGLEAPPPPTGPVFTETDADGGAWRTVRIGDDKLMLDLHTDTAWRFDLANDPGEQTRLPPTAALRDAIDTHLADMKTAAWDTTTGGFSPEDRARLQALGYSD